MDTMREPWSNSNFKGEGEQKLKHHFSIHDRMAQCSENCTLAVHTHVTCVLKALQK